MKAYSKTYPVLKCDLLQLHKRPRKYALPYIGSYSTFCQLSLVNITLTATNIRRKFLFNKVTNYFSTVPT